VGNTGDLCELRVDSAPVQRSADKTQAANIKAVPGAGFRVLGSGSGFRVLIRVEREP
jgi:hypothetical protein